MFTVEHRKHAPPHTEDTDYTGIWRWCVLDDGFVYDHFATEEEADKVAAQMDGEVSPLS